MMRRATASASASAVAVTTTSSFRTYVPIFVPEAPVDNMNAPRMQDQLQTLWGPAEPRIPNTSAGIDFLRRCGLNPAIEQKRETADSIFTQRAEDYFGTNLFVFGSKKHEEDSISYWTSYYEKKYITAMRMFRRTSTSVLGVADAKQQLTDEADLPETIWANDSYFREISFLAANFLQANVTSMEEFEHKLRMCSAEQFLQFIKAFRYQTLTLVPLPSSACWSFEGEQLVDWAKRWKPMQIEAQTNFIPILSDAKSKHTWPVVAEKLAEGYKKVFDILVKREHRQIGSNVKKAWATMTSDERLAAGCAEVDRVYKGLLEGTFDAADPADTSAEWKAEHDEIETILLEDLGVGFTLSDFWSNVTRVNELEFEHLYAANSFKVLQGRAYEQTRMDSMNGDAAHFYKELLETVRLSSFDAGSGCFIPAITPTWCRLNWVKFGAATITHHTAAARRQLLFHHHSLRGVSALAHLYYKLQPLSSTLDYSSPYRYRQSYVAACAEYGVDIVRAEHYYSISGLTKLGNAEEAMGIVTDAVKLAYGAKRRQLCAVTRAENQRLMPITNPVATIVSSSSASSTEGTDATATSKKERWAFGGKRAIKYDHRSPYLDEIAKAVHSDNAVIAAREAAGKCRVQVALMRKSTPEAKAIRNTTVNYLNGEAAKLIAVHPELADVREDAERFCSAVSAGITVDLSQPVAEPAFVNPADKSEWEFVAMVADNIPLSETQTLEVTLPFVTNMPTGLSGSSTERTLLAEGEYCLRLRFVDKILNPSCDPTRVSEAWTPAFEGYDALCPLLKKSLALTEDLNTLIANKNMAVATDDAEGLVKADQQLLVAGDMLIQICSAIRKNGIEVPLQVEFNAGQILTPKGQFYADVLVDLLREGKFSSEKVLNDGLTEVQLKSEVAIRQHWAICNFVGASDEEWFGVRRYVLEDAMEAEAEWWRHDDWLETEMEDCSTLTSRQRYADQLCTLLSARGNDGFDKRAMLGLIKEGKDATTGLRVVGTSATVSGDGAVTGLSFDTYAAKEKNLSVDELLANALNTINSAQFRLNTLAGRKRQTFCRNKIVTTYSEGHRAVFGGKYAKTAHFALNKAIEEAAFSAPTLTIEGGLRDLKPVDRYASEDNPDQRKRSWVHRVERNGVEEDVSTPEHHSTWGI